MSSGFQSNAHGKRLGWGGDSKRRTIAPSSDLGRNAFVFDEDEVVHLLRDAVEREGSKSLLRVIMALIARTSVRS